MLNPEHLDIAIGLSIRLRRKQLDMSQQGLADACGVSFQQIQKYENGHNRISFSRLVQVAHGLKCRVADLVGDIDQAQGLTPAATAALDHIGVPGAAELLREFERFDPIVRRRWLDLAQVLSGKAQLLPVDSLSVDAK